MITVTDGTFTMPSGKVSAALTATAIEYSVTAPETVAFTKGVENGKTTVADSVSFTLSLPAEQVATSVTVKGKTLTANGGVYTFSAGEYLSESTTAGVG
ncbi:MAG: hypothetical protein IJY62_03415 [Clostridia bacterium]|nr:hypothetical protein [Clostridia bacterium]